MSLTEIDHGRRVVDPSVEIACHVVRRTADVGTPSELVGE